MAGQAADALRDALDGLSNRLDPLIDARPVGDGVRVQLEGAQNDLENASSTVDAQSIEAILTNNPDLQKLANLTSTINAKAAQIAASAANVAKIVTIGTRAVALADAFTASSVGTILTAVSALNTAIG